MPPAMNASFSPYDRQQERNRRLLEESPALGSRIVSRVHPFRFDLDATPELSDADVALFEALSIESARLAVESVASLATINEVDHMGGGLDLLPALLPTLSLVNHAETEFTIENAHTSAGYYAALATLGYLDAARFVHFFRRGLDIPGHVSWVPGGTPLNGGRLGVMVPAAVGAALGKRAAWGDKAWVLCHCGDAGWISGQALDGFHIGAIHRAPVTFVMHRNGVQLSGTTASVTFSDPRPVVSALGVEILEIPFLHDTRRLWQALGEARALARAGRPSLVYPTGKSGVPLAQVGETLGVAPELAAFAAKNGVSLDTPVWFPGCLMSYRDLDAMLECLFFVNSLPGGKGHHDGHMKGRDPAAVLANPMLRLSPAHRAALDAWRATPLEEVVTEARPAPGTPNLLVSDADARAAAASLSRPSPKWANAREGVSAAYALVAKTHPASTFVVDCDIAPSTKLDKAYNLLDDDHRFQVSIEEQAGAILANGLSVSTPDPKLVVMSTFAAFFEGIAREGFEMWRYQRNLDGANEGLNVTFHLSHVGSCTGRDHFSGWALDWINLAIGLLPYLDRFYAPCDPHSAFQAVRDLAARSGAHIIGIPRDVLPVLEDPARPGTPLWDAAAPWAPVTPLRTPEGAQKAVLAFGATAYLAAQAADQSPEPVAAYAIGGLPLPPDFLPDLFARHPAGIVTVEDGLVGSPRTTLRGFAALVATAPGAAAVPMRHLGITDPRIAPADGHLQLWEYFGIDVPTLHQALASF